MLNNYSKYACPQTSNHVHHSPTSVTVQKTVLCWHVMWQSLNHMNLLFFSINPLLYWKHSSLFCQHVSNSKQVQLCLVMVWITSLKLICFRLLDVINYRLSKEMSDCFFFFNFTDKFRNSHCDMQLVWNETHWTCFSFI